MLNPTTKKFLELHYKQILEFPTWNIDTKVGYIVAAGNIDPSLTGDIGHMPLDVAQQAVRDFVTEYIRANVV